MGGNLLGNSFSGGLNQQINADMLNGIFDNMGKSTQMGGYNTDFSQWSYNSKTRMWDDGTGNQYQSLPVGVSPDQIGAKSRVNQTIKDLSPFYQGPFEVKRYAKFIRNRLRGKTYVTRDEERTGWFRNE